MTFPVHLHFFYSKKEKVVFPLAIQLTIIIAKIIIFICRCQKLPSFLCKRHASVHVSSTTSQVKSAEAGRQPPLTLHSLSLQYFNYICKPESLEVQIEKCNLINLRDKEGLFVGGNAQLALDSIIIIIILQSVRQTDRLTLPGPPPIYAAQSTHPHWLWPYLHQFISNYKQPTHSPRCSTDGRLLVCSTGLLISAQSSSPRNFICNYLGIKPITTTTMLQYHPELS